MPEIDPLRVAVMEIDALVASLDLEEAHALLRDLEHFLSDTRYPTSDQRYHRCEALRARIAAVIQPA